MLKSLIANKKVLLVIHDNIELRLFTSKFFIEELECSKQIDLAIPVSQDHNFLNDYKHLKDRDINIIDLWPPDNKYLTKKQLLIDLFKKIGFYALNVNSNSCKQKLCLHLGFSLDSLKSQIWKKILYLFCYCVSPLLMPLNLFRLLNIKENRAQMDYDLVIYGRHDSHENLYFSQMCSEKTKHIGLIRNVDGISLKAMPTTNFDYTLCYNNFILIQAKNMFFSSERGDLISIEYPILRDFEVDSINYRDKKRRILYATTSSKFFGDQAIMFDLIYEGLKKNGQLEHFELIIQKHPDDFTEYTKYDDVQVTYPSYKEYKRNSNNRKMLFPSSNDNRKYIENIINYDCVISVGSTILLDYVYANKKAILLNIKVGNDDPSYLLDREHIQYMVKSGVELVSDFNTLVNVLISIKG